MKYIEELESGDSFIDEDGKFYLLTCDHKNNGNRLCFSLSTGLPQWFEASKIVNQNPIYSLDPNNNIIAIKETKKNDSNNNIS